MLENRIKYILDEQLACCLSLLAYPDRIPKMKNKRSNKMNKKIHLGLEDFFFSFSVKSGCVSGICG